MLTPQDKKAILDEHGVDSSQYWMTDDGDIVPMPADNGAMAGVKSAALNLPRTVTGFMGGAAGAAGAGALGLPSGPGAVATGIAGAVAGGAAGSALGDKLQQAIYPKEWLLAQEARQVRNPLASQVGELAPSLALMRPSPTVMRDAGRGISALVRGGAQFGLRPQQAAALGNIGIGAALGGGTALGQGASAQEVLAQTLLGALQHQPTKLGTKLSFDTFQPHVGDVTLRDVVKPADLAAPAPTPDAPVTQSAELDAMRDSLLKQQQNKYTRAFEENIAKMAANDAAMVRQQTVQSAMAQLDPTGRPTEQPVVTPRTSQFTPEPPVRRVEELPLDAQGRPSFKISGEEPFAGQQIPLEPTGAFERGIPTQPGKPAPRSEIPRDLRPIEERIAGARPVEGSDTERPRNFTPTPKGKPPVAAKPGEPGYQDQQRNIRPTQAYNEWYARDMKDLDNVIVKFGKPTNEAGAEVAGVTMPTRDAQTGAREIGISDRAYTDTLPHERTHGLILDVLQHGKPGEKAKMRRLLEQAGVPEEALVQGVGEDVVARFLDSTTDKWRDDFGAFMRSKFGRGTKESLQRDARRVLGSIVARGGGSSKVLRGYKPRGVVPPKTREEEVRPPVAPMDEAQISNAERTYEPTKFEAPINEDPAGLSPEARTEQNTRMTETRDRMRVDEMNKRADEVYQRDFEARKTAAAKAGEELPRYQEFNDKDRVFATDFEKELAKPRPWNVQVAKDGRMAAADIKAAVAKMNPTEQELLKSGGLDEYLKTVIRPNADQLRTWAAENLPRVEVKELGADGNLPDADMQEMAEIQHSWWDNLAQKYRDAVLDLGNTPDTGLRENKLANIVKYAPNTSRETVLRFLELRKKHSGAADNDSATRAYDSANINPRQLKDMPGAVDLLVRLPVKVDKLTRAEYEKRTGRMAPYGYKDDMFEAESPLYSSNHYPKSGDNLLAHVRAYEHTMPDGERVLRVFELQSDWAQDRRKFEAEHKALVKEMAELKAAGKHYNEVPPIEEDHGTKDHPLLPHHQRLALKAAIEHARKRGIKRVVIDDAETAMMTEGHDRMRITHDTQGNRVAPNDAPAIPQERGMRLAYDQVLNQMMRDLSGDGVKVELGEHRNAFDQVERTEMQPGHGMGFGSRREAEVFVQENPGYEFRVRSSPLYGDIFEAVRTIPKPTRDDLIFRNPDGTPKTRSTGFAYDTSAAQARRDAGEPFSYAGRRYQEFGPNVPDRTYGKTPPADDRISMSPFESASQTAARSKNPVVKYIGSRLSELFPAQRAMQGKYRALPEAFAGLKEKDSDALIRHLITEDRTGVARPIAPNLKEAYDNVRSTLRQMRADQIAAGQPRSDGSTPGTDPTYMFNIVDPSVRKTLRDEVDSPRYEHLKKSFIDFNTKLQHAKGVPLKTAQDRANQYFERYKSNIKKQVVDNTFDFGSVSLPAGSKLPDNWLHHSPADAARQYVRDWSRARTFHDTIRTDEDAMAALGQDYYFKGGKQVPVTRKVSPVANDSNISHLLNEALGVNSGSQDKVTSALGRAASTLWLANPITRSVDIATSAFKALGYVRPQHIPGLIGNLKSFGKSIKNVHDTGWVKDDGNTIVGEVLGAGEAFSSGIDKFSKGVTKFTGSEFLENFGRTLAQNTGEYIARTNKSLASGGDKRAAEFLDRVAPNWKTLSEAELGTRIGQLFQGRYDATNLPKWLSDSPAAPFFSLSRWNVEQWNNFREMAIKPARRGDVAPLISMMIAGALGGVGVKEIREALGGRKSKIATLKELQEAPEGSAKYQEIVRYFGNLMQLTGTMGIVSEVASMALDAAAKDRPPAPTMPAYEVITDIIPRGIAAANAMVDGEDPLTVLKALGRDIGNEHVSFYRFIETNLGRAGVLPDVGEDVKDAAARRDLRVGKRLRGEPVRVAIDMPIDYSRAEERAVERTRDPAEMKAAAGALKTKLRAIPDKEERARKLRSAAASRVSYMPSKANDPKAYREQMDFVRRTQGDAKAEELRMRYMRDTKNADWRRTKFNP